MEDLSLLFDLIRTPGVSGREERVRELVARQMTGLVKTVTTDAMGNLIGHRPGKGPKVALVAHMDEVGFLVSKIEKEGFLRIMPMGGVDPRVLGAQKVMIHGRRDIPGIVGSVPPHLQKKGKTPAVKEALPIEESFVDLGLPPDEVVAQVAVGDAVTFAIEPWENDTALFGKALDDRIGLFIMLSAVARVKETGCDLYLIASTQEEYGLRGVGPAVYGIEPQIVLALEGTVASDTPELKLPANALPVAQGKGPEIRITDNRMISHRGLADFLAETARKGNIPHQVIVKNTGATDAAAGQIVAAGVKACAVSVPVRYIHAPIGMVRKSDIDRSIDLTAAVLKALPSHLF